MLVAEVRWLNLQNGEETRTAAIRSRATAADPCGALRRHPSTTSVNSSQRLKLRCTRASKKSNHEHDLQRVVLTIWMRSTSVPASRAFLCRAATERIFFRHVIDARWMST